MRLDSEQRRFVECGYAMVYRGGHGMERYIEQALDAFGRQAMPNTTCSTHSETRAARARTELSRRPSPTSTNFYPMTLISEAG